MWFVLVPCDIYLVWRRCHGRCTLTELCAINSKYAFKNLCALGKCLVNAVVTMCFLAIFVAVQLQSEVIMLATPSPWSRSWGRSCNSLRPSFSSMKCCSSIVAYERTFQLYVADYYSECIWRWCMMQWTEILKI